MVSRLPSWEGRRTRMPIPEALPGVFFTPFLAGNLLYQFSASGTVYCIDPEQQQIVSEGQASNLDNGRNGVTVGSVQLPSACPTDGTIAVGFPQAAAGICGLLSRHGDTSMLFSTGFADGTGAETFCDFSNGPAEYACYTTTSTLLQGQTQWFFCRKNDSTVTIIPSSFGGFSTSAGVDCDRAGNWFIFSSSGPQLQTTHTLIRQAANGTGFVWAVNPDHTGATIPAYSNPISGFDKQVCVGPPFNDSGVWHQNVYVSIHAGWLSCHDCRSGAFVAGGATTLRPSQLSATTDGLILMDTITITKIDLKTLATIWTHDPTKFTPSLTPSRVAVDACGDVIYTTGADAQGAVHIRKIKSADGKPISDQAFFLPIAGQPIVSGAGRIGGYSWCGENWVNAGSPPISFS
jgi:hypothetical protein